MTTAAGCVIMMMAARFSSAPEVAEVGDSLRARLVALAAADAAAYTEVLSTRGAARREALRRATEVPREIALVAAEVAVLAGRLAAEGNPRLHGDARVAELIAGAAATAAGVLVDINMAEQP